MYLVMYMNIGKNYFKLNGTDTYLKPVYITTPPSSHDSGHLSMPIMASVKQLGQPLISTNHLTLNFTSSKLEHCATF